MIFHVQSRTVAASKRYLITS